MKKLEISSNIVYLPRPGYIYLVNAVGTDSFKIGMTKQSVLQRINVLQTGCPLRLRYVYHSYVEDMQKTERELHSTFDSFCQIGEWFCLTHFHVKECIKLMRLMQVQEPTLLIEVDKIKESYEEEVLLNIVDLSLENNELPSSLLEFPNSELLHEVHYNPEPTFTTMDLNWKQAATLINRLRGELNQTQIIERLWECKKGGSEAWKKAYTQFKDLTNEKE